MRRTLSAILVIIITAMLFSACGKTGNPYHILYFKDGTKSEKATATFFNSDSKESVDVEMEKVSEDDDSFTFSCEGDCSLYNMAYVTYGDSVTSKFAFNKCVSGWYRTPTYFLPYTEGEEINYFPEMDDVTLESSFGYKKNIHIWKPEDYDASSKEKYATIYVLDGHNLISNGEDILNYYLASPEQVRSMISTTGYKAIVVGIENLYARDNELVPKIGVTRDSEFFGEQEFESMDGIQFAQFVAEELVPYIQENYNVYTDALHTSITGNSFGGLESFYITMEYPETFGTVGAISPSFWQFDDATWKKFLSDKTFDANSPFVYMYTGPGVPEGTVPSATNQPKDTDPDVSQMYQRLKDMGYPAEKLVLHFNEEGEHNGLFWRAVFPEFLNAMVYQKIEPLQQKSE
ncbi:MAG: esterase family protein [Ruminococcus sp.]|nr:esterase family protein [Ruminococcus sp.]